MIVICGKPISHGIGIGKLVIYEQLKKDISKQAKSQEEARRFYKARECVSRKLEDLQQETSKMADGSSAAIFEAHRMLLDDALLEEQVVNEIQTKGSSAEDAIRSVFDEHAKNLACVEDTYMQERAADIRDVCKQLLMVLSSTESDEMELETGAIVFAEEFYPSDILTFAKQKVSGFISSKNTPLSHAAILAKAMNIPMVTGIILPDEEKKVGKQVGLDAITGEIYFEPDAETVQRLLRKQCEEQQKVQELEGYQGLEDATISGHGISICANANSLDEIDQAVLYDVKGIGLLRSEFFWMQSETAPTEEEQFQVYKEAVLRTKGRSVVIRTFDFSEDKEPFFLKKEERKTEFLQRLLESQLRAICRATQYGDVKILFPMIHSAKEGKEKKELALRIYDAVFAQNRAISSVVEIGFMLETKTAIQDSDKLAKVGEFFKIGTNDLTRQNPIEDVLQMVQVAIENVHAEGKPIGVCGEIASDISLTEMFVQWGVDELSVPPTKVLQLRKRIREIE